MWTRLSLLLLGVWLSWGLRSPAGPFWCGWKRAGPAGEPLILSVEATGGGVTWEMPAAPTPTPASTRRRRRGRMLLEQQQQQQLRVTDEYEVDWGDGTSSVCPGENGRCRHVYARAGTFEVHARGPVLGWALTPEWRERNGNSTSLRRILQWGGVEPAREGGHHFYRARELLQLPPLGELQGAELVRNWSYSFSELGGSELRTSLAGLRVRDAEDLTGLAAWSPGVAPDVQGWDTSRVTSLALAFAGSVSSVIPGLGDLNTSSLQNASGAFLNAAELQVSRLEWDVRSLRDASYMFMGAKSFNADLSSWRAPNLQNFDFMFYGASSFADQSQITGWGVPENASRAGLFENTPPQNPSSSPLPSSSTSISASASTSPLPSTSTSSTSSSSTSARAATETASATASATASETASETATPSLWPPDDSSSSSSSSYYDWSSSSWSGSDSSSSGSAPLSPNCPAGYAWRHVASPYTLGLPAAGAEASGGNVWTLSASSSWRCTSPPQALDANSATAWASAWGTYDFAGHTTPAAALTFGVEGVPEGVRGEYLELSSSDDTRRAGLVGVELWPFSAFAGAPLYSIAALHVVGSNDGGQSWSTVYNDTIALGGLGISAGRSADAVLGGQFWSRFRFIFTAAYQSSEPGVGGLVPACTEQVALGRLNPRLLEQRPGACWDVDECAAAAHDCGGDRHCVNTAGGFRCDCPVGYAAAGPDCQDVDECASDAGPPTFVLQQLVLRGWRLRASSSSSAPGGAELAPLPDADGAGPWTSALGTYDTTAAAGAGQGALACAANATSAAAWTSNIDGRPEGGGRLSGEYLELSAGSPLDRAGLAQVEVYPGSGAGPDSGAGASSAARLHILGSNDGGASWTTVYAGSPLEPAKAWGLSSGRAGRPLDGRYWNRFRFVVPVALGCTGQVALGRLNPLLLELRRVCQDMDGGCANTPSCSGDQRCTNTVGSFACECMLGYAPAALLPGCEDVDECQLGTHDCAANQRCTNTVGSFTCACAAGYVARQAMYQLKLAPPTSVGGATTVGWLLSASSNNSTAADTGAGGWISAPSTYGNGSAGAISLACVGDATANAALTMNVDGQPAGVRGEYLELTSTASSRHAGLRVLSLFPYQPAENGPLYWLAALRVVGSNDGGLSWTTVYASAGPWGTPQSSIEGLTVAVRFVQPDALVLGGLYWSKLRFILPAAYQRLPAGGQAHCTGQAGGRFSADLLEQESTCDDVNECQLGTHNCLLGQSCTNTAGGFSCN